MQIKYVPGLKVWISKSGIETLAERISERIIAYAHENWSSMIDEDGDISVDEDGIVSRELEHVAQDYPEGLFQVIFNHRSVGSALDEVKSIVEELASNAKEWHEANRSIYAMYRYHGVSWRDFA